MPNSCRRRGAKDGQSLVESCLVIFLIAFIFAGLFQVSQLFAAREVLNHAAARGARAKTVGFNWWMVEKSIRVASIPNAGLLTAPPFQDQDATLANLMRTRRPGAMWEEVLGIVPASQQFDLEIARIPEYLASENDVRSDYILDYADWDSVRGDHVSGAPGSSSADPILHIRVNQNYPLRIPGHRAFYAPPPGGPDDVDTIRLDGESYIENYYPLYIDDMCW